MHHDPTPSYDLITASLDDVRPLFERFHPYKSLGRVATYCFAVREDSGLVAAYVWLPPPPGAAKSVCPECPQGVLALSRMVAVPREERQLNHVSKPLRRIMHKEIDRTRWPVLVTYSDESVNHKGHVYKCSGWQPTVRNRNRTMTVDGKRVSTYAAGETRLVEGSEFGYAYMQRWEHRIDNPAHVFAENWMRVPIEGKKWFSGGQAYTYVKKEKSR